MGKRIRAREAQRRRDDNVVRAVLKSHSEKVGPRTRAYAPDCFDEFDYQYRKKVDALRGYTLRPPTDWRCRIKSKSEEKRFLDLVRFSFARYRVPAHLEHVWIDDDFGGPTMPDPVTARGVEGPDLLRWYLVAAQGGSLYKQEAHPWLSKQECHHFLNAPADVSYVRRAMWYAIARAQSDRKAAALNVAHSRIGCYPIAWSWWKEVARFFARNPTTVDEIDDLADFLFVAKQEDAVFTLKGRTLATLRRRMEDWHRALRKSQAIGGGAWAGSPLPDIDYEVGKAHHRAIWRFRQIKTGNDLYQEGQQMHHCVSTYKGRCMSGDISIWSLSYEFPIGRAHRGVTMEVRSDGMIAQCRGFANRLPYPNEVAMVKRWARDYDLTWKNWSW